MEIVGDGGMNGGDGLPKAIPKMLHAGGQLMRTEAADGVKGSLGVP